MNEIIFKIFTQIKARLGRCEKVGEDPFGNTYYQSKKVRNDGRFSRIVVYKGRAEGSKVPPEWHGWLHYMTDMPPKGRPLKQPWQKTHLPNLTGTKFSSCPKATSNISYKPLYEAWSPRGLKEK